MSTGCSLSSTDDARGFLVAACLGGLGIAHILLFDSGEVGERKFGVDGLDVGHRVDSAVDMNDVAVLETAHHVRNGVGLADVGQKLVAQALALGRAGHQSRDVDEFDRRRKDALRVRYLGQRRQARIGHFDDAHVWLDGAKRVVLGRDASLCQRVEQGGFADVGQADDAAFDTHGDSF